VAAASLTSSTMAEAERKSNGASPVILPLFGLLEMHDQHSSSAMDSSKVQGSSTAAAAAAQLEVLCMSSSVEDHDGASRSGIFVGHDQFPLPATNSFKVEESSTTAAAAHLEFQGEASRSGSELETSSFQYSPLIGDADIRLVILEPGRDHGPVNCRLIHISLDESPVYEALSYAWGDATILGQTILLDGRPFSIGINLEGALLNLRDDAIENPGERTLWIDAISINQRDILERNAQVQKMKAIFSSATKVVIWLGNYHEPLDDSLEFDTGIWGFDRLDKGTREGLLRTNDLLGRMKRFYSELKKGFNQPDDSFLLAAKHDWGNLQRLFMRPWFEVSNKHHPI
jgi:hypothetical protein